MVAAPCLLPWRKVPHGIGCEFCRFAHNGKPPELKEVEDLRHWVRELAATVMWLSGTVVPDLKRWQQD